MRYYIEGWWRAPGGAYGYEVVEVESPPWGTLLEGSGPFEDVPLVLRLSQIASEGDLPEILLTWNANDGVVWPCSPWLYPFQWRVTLPGERVGRGFIVVGTEETVRAEYPDAEIERSYYGW